VKFHVTLEVEIERPAETVFDYLAETENFPTWSDEFSKVEREGGPVGQGTQSRLWLQPPTSLGGLLLGREAQRKNQPPTEVQAHWADYDRPTKLVSKAEPILRGRAVVHTVQTFVLQPKDGRTGMQVTWDREVENVPFDRLAAVIMKPLITREIRRSQTKSLGQLKSILEGGGEDG
jgi:uncharacterized protein YndB with AHSA1/START domain